MAKFKLKEGHCPRCVKNVVTTDKSRPHEVYIEPGQTFECADDLSKKRAYEPVKATARKTSKAAD